jgi:hypothetical protein
MDRSTRRTLILLGIVVVVLLALFVMAAAHNPDDTSPGSGCSFSQRESWRARLLRPEPVAPGQLGGCTTVPGPFIIHGTCELRVAAADARSRQLVIETLDAIELRLDTSADGRSITLRDELKPDESRSISIAKDGQIVRFRCLTGTTCRAGIK